MAPQLPAVPDGNRTFPQRDEASGSPGTNGRMRCREPSGVYLLRRPHPFPHKKVIAPPRKSSTTQSLRMSATNSNSPPTPKRIRPIRKKVVPTSYSACPNNPRTLDGLCKILSSKNRYLLKLNKICHSKEVYERYL